MFKANRTERVTPLSDHQLIALLDALPDALIIVNDNATILYANETAAGTIRAAKEDILGNSLWQSFPQLVTLELYQALIRASQTREHFQVEYRSLVASTWLHVHISPTSMGIMISIQNDAEPTSTIQEAYAKKEQIPKDILEYLATTVVILTPEGRILGGNQAPLKAIQVQQAEVIGKLFPETPWWSDSLVAQKQLSAAIARASKGETIHFETQTRWQGGSHVDRVAMVAPHMDEDGHIDYLIYSSHDITESKRVENELRSLVEALPHFIWVARPDGASEYSNQQWCNYTNKTVEQLQGDGWAQCLHPEDQPHVLDIWRSSIQTGTPYQTEHRIQNGKTGEYRWFLARGMPLRDSQGNIVRWLGTCTDIDERKSIEKALRQSQEHVHALMDSNIIGIISADSEEIVEANDAFLNMTGYTREDISNRRVSWISMTPPEYMAISQQAHLELELHGYMNPYEKEYICKDGSRLPVLVGGVALYGNPLRNIDFVLDISARKELEQRKDDFISTASHELKTPLTSLKLQTQLLGRQLERQRGTNEITALARIDKQVRQLERLIGELLDVSKIQSGKLDYIPETMNLHELLRDVVETAQQMSNTHTIIVHGNAPTSLIGDRDRLSQVFTNLLSNAIKYSPDADTVEIDISTSEETVTVSVRDQGIGIVREQREKIFERFYRATIPDQRVFPGLGMGLYIVAEIVKQHGGAITVESEAGKGSTFCVTLPLAGHAAE